MRESVRPAPPATGRWGGRRVRWLGYAFVGAGLAMIPWMARLNATLPTSATAAHWPQAWIGLDALEALGFVGIGVLAVRGDRRLALPAAWTAALLTADAWFDTMTSAGPDFAEALTQALTAELPLAALCAFLAWWVSRH